MGLFRVIFPAFNRFFPGKRWVRVTLRSLHLCGVCGVVGGVFFDIPVKQLVEFYLISLSSGLFLMLIDVYSNGIWLIQNRGWVILVKVVVLANIDVFGDQSKWVLLIIVFVSGIVSHATADQRYYSIYHRRRVDLL